MKNCKTGVMIGLAKRNVFRTSFLTGVGGYIYQSPKLSLFKWVERSDTKFGALATRLLNLGQLVKTIKPGLKYALYLV